MSATAEKEWTLMFFFATDNPIAPAVVTQLKALKQAGFHHDVNVIAQFDPQTEGTPTHIFEVNLVNKLKHDKPNIGFGNDPFVRTLMEDKLWNDQTDRDGKYLIRNLLKQSLAKKGVAYDPPFPPPETEADADGPQAAGGAANPSRPKEPDPVKSLNAFLKFCRENYPARHYMLFLLGHGVIVGNDVFLFDEHVDGNEHSLSLKELGDTLREFKRGIKEQNAEAEFELVSFHSCSVSSLEVAYELQEEGDASRAVANYMLASQGSAFPGSWPYREILIRVFNDVEGYANSGAEIDVRRMVVKIFYYILHNSTDFLLAGYPFQLCLCDLNKVAAVTEPLKRLAAELIRGLGDPSTRDFVLLSHWKSISFWQESYTDLYDFCFCLRARCEEFAKGSGGMGGSIDSIHTACGEVMDQLVNGVEGNDDRLIVRAAFAGPTYQYSHGLSIFFPWSRPLDNFMAAYQEYRFEITSWRTFLEAYFEETMRRPRQDERDVKAPLTPPPDDDAMLQEDIASICFNNGGALRAVNAPGSAQPMALVKTHPGDPLGGDCSCPSVKNYPHDTRPRRERVNQAYDQSLLSDPDAFDVL